MKIELNRLARAIHLDVEELADGLYCVTGGAEPHTVDLHEEQWCRCRDVAKYRGVHCQHELAVKLHRGDRDCLRSLRYWVPRPGAVRLVRQQAA